jgi:uncharacterized lipoprotein YajG
MKHIRSLAALVPLVGLLLFFGCAQANNTPPPADLSTSPAAQAKFTEAFSGVSLATSGGTLPSTITVSGSRRPTRSTKR